MKEKYYFVVKKDLNYRRIEDLNDLEHCGEYMFIAEAEKYNFPDVENSFNAVIVDSFGTQTHFDYRGYEFHTFNVMPLESHLHLHAYFITPGGETIVQSFRRDLKDNLPLEEYIPVKPEWDERTMFKDIFGFIDNCIEFGDKSYKRIVDLERLVFEKDALYRKSVSDFEIFKTNVKIMTGCVIQELKRFA